MQIVYFLTYDYSFKTWDETGNISREREYFNYITEKFDDYFFYFISYGDESDKIYNEKFNNSKIIPIYEYIKYDKNKFIRFIRSFKIPFVLKKILSEEKIDIIKQNQLQGSWVSLVFKIICNKPLIVRTGYDVLSFKTQEKKGILTICFYYLLTQITILFSNIYTVTSKADKKFLINKFMFSHSKLKIRPNFISIDNNISFKNKKNNDIVMIGRLESQKNYEYIISQFSNSGFQIVNYGKGKKLDTLMKTAKDLNTDINFLDVIPNKQLITVLQNHKFFISSSFYEGNPKGILEAMGSGCIVFVANNKNTKEIIKDGVNGFLFELSENNLLDLFINTIERTDLINISESAIKSVQKNNSLKLLVENESNDFLEILD
jgi:glycosyltransferase involved in cell wall biosynthesis